MKWNKYSVDITIDTTMNKVVNGVRIHCTYIESVTVVRVKVWQSSKWSENININKVKLWCTYIENMKVY